MEFRIHTIANTKIAEFVSDDLMIAATQDAVDVLGNLYYEECDRVILHERNIAPDFFDLKNGIAGEILQKFSNYRTRLAIVGDFGRFESKSVKDFIFESNKFRQVNFVPTLEAALDVLSK